MGDRLGTAGAVGFFFFFFPFNNFNNNHYFPLMQVHPDVQTSGQFLRVLVYNITDVWL